MDEDEFWAIIDTARAMPEQPFSTALVDVLAALPLDRVLAYEQRFEALHEAVYRWDVWAAAYLIGGGCSDDSFMDFRAGLIGLGRHWYERVAAAPDALAGHPLALGAASAAGLEEALFSEEIAYAAMRAYERQTGVDGSFYAAQDAFAAARSGGRREEESAGVADQASALSRALPDQTSMGEDFDFDDEAEIRRRLPRLAALCYDE
jgi:hypothetical protein